MTEDPLRIPSAVAGIPLMDPPTETGGTFLPVASIPKRLKIEDMIPIWIQWTKTDIQQNFLGPMELHVLEWPFEPPGIRRPYLSYPLKARGRWN
jgi:hypothetical protein